MSDDLLTQCADALEFAAPHSTIASVTAARLHGLWLPDLPNAIHLASATPDRAGRQMTRTRRAPFVAHRFQLQPGDVTAIHGLRVTSPARTWRDLSRLLPLPDLVAAGDSVLRGGTTVEELHALLNSMPQAPSSRRAREALPLLDARSRSRPETHLRVAVAGLSAVPFAVNCPIHRRDGGWLAEPDLSLAPARIALEYQGADHAELHRMRRDLTRSMDLRQDGWCVLLYGPAEVLGRPWQVRAEVRAELLARAPELLIRRIRRGGTSR